MKRFKWAVLLSLTLLLLAGGASARENVIEGDINKAAGSLEIPRGTTVNGNVCLLYTSPDPEARKRVELCGNRRGPRP